MHTPRVLLAVVGVAVVLNATPGATERQARERHVYVGVTTSNGAPVPGLTPKDFVVKEDDRTREVLRVGAAPPPSHIAILVDTSEGAASMIAEIRDGVSAFVQRLANLEPTPAISIVSFGERPTVDADFTTSLPVVAGAIVKLFPRSGSGAYLLDAIVETSKTLKKNRAAQSAIVAFTIDESTEYSTVRADRVNDALRDAGASLWVVQLGSARQSDSSEGHERERVLSDATKSSGGMDRPVLSPASIGAGFTAIASAIMTRYDVVYGRPESLVPPSRLNIEARDRGWRVAAPRWTGE